MKRTNMERHQRDLKKSEKKERMLSKKSDTRNSNPSVGDYINNLFSLFRYDEETIYNATNDCKILELLDNLRKDYPEKQIDNVLRKGIKKTNIIQKEKAFNELKNMSDSLCI